jgi:hypothetical protein
MTTHKKTGWRIEVVESEIDGFKAEVYPPKTDDNADVIQIEFVGETAAAVKGLATKYLDHVIDLDGWSAVEAAYTGAVKGDKDSIGKAKAVIGELLEVYEAVDMEDGDLGVWLAKAHWKARLTNIVLREALAAQPSLKSIITRDVIDAAESAPDDIQIVIDDMDGPEDDDEDDGDDEDGDEDVCEECGEDEDYCDCDSDDDEE